MKRKDAWRDLCGLVQENDGLPTRDCGEWTEDKLWFWHRYLHITTQAMVDNPRWKNGLAYLDLFSGPGICEVKGSSKRLPGSVLIAACTPKPFRKIVAIDLIPDLARACRTRLGRIAPDRDAVVIEGDSNAVIGRALAEIPEGCLTIAVLDPPGMDYHFSTIAKIANSRRTDFLLLFADAIDAVRNLDVYAQQNESKLDLILGRGWASKWNAIPNHSPESKRQFFSDTLKSRFKLELGYSGFGEKRINGPNGALYKLLFASKHERGLDFWHKTVGKDRQGQSELF